MGKSQLNFQYISPKCSKSKARCGNNVIIRWIKNTWYGLWPLLTEVEKTARACVKLRFEIVVMSILAAQSERQRTLSLPAQRSRTVSQPKTTLHRFQHDVI